jgi:hypothetical protein
MYKGIIKGVLPKITRENIFQVEIKIQMDSGPIVEALLGDREKSTVFPVDHFQTENKKTFLHKAQNYGDRILGRECVVINEQVSFPLWEPIK